MSHVEFWAYGPSGKIRRIIGWGESSTNGKVRSGTSSLTVDEQWPSGDWEIRFVSYADKVGNSAQTNAGFDDLDFSSLGFTVAGTEADVSAPVLTSFSRISPKTVHPGDTIKFNWTASDSSPMSHVEFWAYGPSGKIRRIIGWGESSTNGKVRSGTSSLTVDEQWPSGDWEIRFVSYADKVGNSAQTNAGFDDLDFSSLGFTVAQNTIVTPEPIRFIDSDGYLNDSYYVPTTIGVKYFLEGKEIPSGKYKGTGNISITAMSSRGYKLSADSITDWSHTFESSLDSSVPLITGELQVGKLLHLIPGTWTQDTAFSFQWAANGNPIHGATESSLPLTADLTGKSITVTVTGSLNGYTTTSKTSTPTSKIAAGALKTAIPTVTGTATVGQTLTAIPGAWGPEGVQFSYQWAANGNPIHGATESSLPLTADLTGKSITVTVTGSLNGYTTTSKTSTPTSAIGPLLIKAEAPTSDRASGSYTVPLVPGVTYLVDGVEKKAGTYSSGYKKVTIVARAAAGYSLAGTSTWTLDLAQIQVSARKPTANFSTQTLTIPNVPGVSYSVDGTVRKPGNYRFSKQIVVIAQASAANYMVKEASWKYDLRTIVTASKPVFDAKKNTVKIPAKTGAAYYINGTKKKAGTYKYTGTGTVTA
ncbi:hypothetical protein ACX8Z8_15995, partial [Glutamicibacter soli]